MPSYPLVYRHNGVHFCYIPGHCCSMLDDIKKTLWATADKLRANMDAAEYKHLVLGLIFLKYVSDTLPIVHFPASH